MSVQKRPSIPTFGAAFRHVRTKTGYGYTEVSRAVGKDRDVIRSWERGEAYPQGRDLPRLCAFMRELRPYLRLIPRHHHETHEDVEGFGNVWASEMTDKPKVIMRKIQEEEAAQEAEAAAAAPSTPPVPPIPPQEIPTKFSDALRMARLEEGMTQTELAELIDVHAATVSGWEKEVSVPVRVNYIKLCDLLPALKNGPVPPVRDIDPPVGTAARKAIASVSEPPVRNGLMPGASLSPPSPPPTPHIPPQALPPPQNNLSTLAENWGRAMNVQEQVRELVQRLKEELDVAVQTLQQAEETTEKARQELVGAAQKAASSKS